MRISLSILLLFLTACNPTGGEQQLNNYNNRLARVLSLPVTETELPPVAPLPAVRDLRKPLPDIRLTLSEVYVTRSCHLDTLIAERNSSLGKVYHVSQQLLYELRLLAQLKYCLQQPWADTELAALLSESYTLKQQSIQHALYNMLLTDNTIRQQLQGKPRLLTLNAAGFAETLSTLQTLLQLQQLITDENWQQAAQIDIEHQLAILYRYDFIARLQYSLRYSSHWLARLNNALSVTDSSSICPGKRTGEKMTILTNVLHLYFIGEVQPYMAQLTRYQQQLWPVLEQLYAGTPVSPHLTRRFIAPANSLQQNLLNHVAWWQQLAKYCQASLTG
ncbi:DUF3080 family protein [Chromatiaceae bacterium AAb-1]|nr:DUF3080 family protein [Chromatiaceae bacterium AAb-1]